MFRTVCDAFPIALRIASSTLTGLLPTISLSRYTWSLTLPPRRTPVVFRAWHVSPVGALRTSLRSSRIRRPTEPADLRSQEPSGRSRTTSRIPAMTALPTPKPHRPGSPAHRPGRRPDDGPPGPTGAGRGWRGEVVGLG